MTINANETSSTTPGTTGTTATTGTTGTTETPGTTGTTAPAGPTPALNAYEQLVANLNNAIDALVAQIPELQAPHLSTPKFVRTHLNVPLEFIAGAVAAVNNSPALQASNMFNADEGRAVLQFIGAFQPLQDKVSLLAQNLQFTINERKANIGVKAQMLYGAAKQVARLPENVTVVGHVKLLKERLAKGKRPRKPKVPAPSPATGSGTVTTPVTTTAPVPVTTTTPVTVVTQPHAISGQEGGAQP